MEHLKHESRGQPTAMDTAISNRQESRLDGRLRLTFSGMDAKEIVMDTAVVTDVCRDGIGASSERVLKLGMDLALFIECPDFKDDLCVPDARVVWVSGNHFVISIQTMKMEDQDRLHRTFLSACRKT
ncbi:MAG: hypothetical protein OEY21_00900 [Nitrospira sp.]|nr:hypothetical protein [Nitrospira sp.]